MLTIYIEGLNKSVYQLTNLPSDLGNYCLNFNEEASEPMSIIGEFTTAKLEEVFTNISKHYKLEDILLSTKEDFEMENGSMEIPGGYFYKGNSSKYIKIHTQIDKVKLLIIINISHVVYSIIKNLYTYYGTISIIEEKCVCEKDKELRIPITGNPVSDADIYKVYDEDGVWRGEVEIECYDCMGNVVYYQDKINYCPICGRPLD